MTHKTLTKRSPKPLKTPSQLDLVAAYQLFIRAWLREHLSRDAAEQTPPMVSPVTSMMHS